MTVVVCMAARGEQVQQAGWPCEQQSQRISCMYQQLGKKGLPAAPGSNGDTALSASEAANACMAD